MFHIQSLGGVEIRDSTGNPVRLRSKKHSALLVYLASAGRRVYTRDVLARLLWDTPIEKARHSLSQAIYDIRRNLPGVLATTSGDAIRLEPLKYRFDVAEFERAVKTGDLSTAVDLFRGPFADNLVNAGTDDYERWAEGERLRLARLGALALRRHVRQCDESGRWGEMCVAALRLVKLTALDEEAHRALMRGLWLHGDAASALRHYEEVVVPLEAELPEGISEKTRLLARRIGSTPAPEPWDDNLGELRTPFVGREAELEALRTAAREIRSLPATAMLIAGEPGIGKSRLVKEFVRSVALEELQLLESRCYPAEADVPYGPVIDGLRQIATELSRRSGSDLSSFTRIGHLLPEFEHLIKDEEDKVDPAAWRRRLYEEVRGLLRLALTDKPLLWIIEDVQWMDATSTSLLHYVTRRLEGFPFLLIATIRVSRNEELPEALPAMSPASSEFTREVRLSALSSNQIVEILRRAAPDPAHQPALDLARRLAGGNPFYALEVFRAAIGSTKWAVEASRWDPLTDSRLSKVLAIRLTGLSRRAVTLLQSMSVLERHTSPGAVAAVAGLTLTEAAAVSGDLYDRGLLHDREGRLEFVNDIVREYVYAEMSALQKASLHLTAARYLRSQASANSATLARHYHYGDDRPLTYKYALLAAREAKEAGGQMEAAAMAGLAVESSLGKEERLTALHLLAEAELESALLVRAKEHFNEILRLDQEMEPEQRVAVKLRLIETLAEQSDWNGAKVTLAQLSEDLDSVRDLSRRLQSQAESLFWTLKVATRQNDNTTARRVAILAESISNTAESDPSIEPTARVNAILSLATYAAFYESAERAQVLLAQVKTTMGDLPPALAERAHLVSGMTAIRAARWDECEHEFSAALSYATRRNDLIRLCGLWNNLACSSLEQGKWDDFEAWARRVEAVQTDIEDPLDTFLPLVLNRANALFYQGMAKKAGELYQKALTLARMRGSLEFLPEILSCVGLVALQLGNAVAVNETWGEVVGLNKEQLIGPQELFKYEWFRAYMCDRLGIDGALDRLLDAAERYALLDVPSHLKLMWLGSIMFGPAFANAAGQTPDRARSSLFENRLGWFAGFAQRWIRAARARMPSP